MARILKATGMVIGALLLVATVYLFIADFSSFKPRVEAIVSDATGREFRIDGDFSIKALPSPTVLVEDATLAGPAWATAPEMLRIGHFSGRVGLWSLLFRPVVVHELTIRDVTVVMETNEDGDKNWAFDRRAEPGDAEDEESGSTELPVDLRHSTIENVSVTYRRPNADDQTLSLRNFALESGQDDVRSYTADAVLDELPVSVDGTYADHMVDLSAQVGEIEFRTTSSFRGNTVAVDLSLGTIDEVGRLMTIEGLPAEELSLKGDIELDGQVIRLSDVAAMIGTLRVTMDGAIDAGAATAQLNVNAEGPHLDLLRPGLPRIPFAIRAAASLGSESVTLDPLDIEFGESAVSATLNASVGDVPAVELTARSPLLDLTPFLPEESEADSQTRDTVGEASGERFVFNEEPLPLDVLEKGRADVDVEIKRLKLPATEYSDFAVALSVQDGKLELGNRFAGEFGGTFQNRITVIKRGSSAELDVNIDADGMKLVTLAGPDISEEDIPVSAAEVAITASGSTPRALASSVDGRVLFMQGPGLINNSIIGKLSGDILAQLFSALNPFAREEELSNWECSVFGVDFESGLGSIEPLLLQGEKIMVVGGGTIDLNDEKLDIEFNTKPRQGVGISADMFVTPFVALSGTLASPSVGLNEKGLLLSGGAAFLTGGLSFLYQGLADRATAQADQCGKAFEEIGETIPGAGGRNPGEHE